MPVDAPHGLRELEAVYLRHHDVGDDQLVKIVVHLVIGGAGAEAALGVKAAVI